MTILVHKKVMAKLPNTLKDDFVLNHEAEDEELDNKLQIFDLILDKEQSKIRVEKKPQTRVIVSEDIFPKMQREIDKKNFK